MSFDNDKINQTFNILDTQDKETAISYIVQDMLQFPNLKEASEYVDQLGIHPKIKDSLLDISAKYIEITNEISTVVDMIHKNTKNDAVSYIVERMNQHNTTSSSYQYLFSLVSNSEIKKIQPDILQEYMLSLQNNNSVQTKDKNTTQVVNSKTPQEQEIYQVLNILNTKGKDTALNHVVNKMFKYNDDIQASKYMMNLFTDKTISSALMHDIPKKYSKLVNADKTRQEDQHLHHQNKQKESNNWSTEERIEKEIMTISSILDLDLKGRDKAISYMSHKMNQLRNSIEAVQYIIILSSRNDKINEMKIDTIDNYKSLSKKYNQYYNTPTMKTLNKKPPTYKSDINNILNILNTKGKDATIDYVVAQIGKDEHKLNEYVDKIMQDLGKVSKEDRAKLTQLYSDVMNEVKDLSKQKPESTKFQDIVKAEKNNTKPRSKSI